MPSPKNVYANNTNDANGDDLLLGVYESKDEENTIMEEIIEEVS